MTQNYVTAIPLHRELPFDKETTEPVLIRITPHTPEKRAPLHVIAVVDTSASMKEPSQRYSMPGYYRPRLDLARSALEKLADNLQEGDQFSLVSFSDAADTLQEGYRITSSRYSQGRDNKILSLRANGWTNMEEGLAQAKGLVYRAPTGYQNVIFLFTDGQVNRGVTQVEQLVERMPANTRLFAFGFGEGYNDALLEALATKGQGTSTYVDDLEKLPVAFAHALGASATLWSDARLTLDCSRYVSVNVLSDTLGIARTGNVLSLNLGELSGPVDVVLDVTYKARQKYLKDTHKAIKGTLTAVGYKQVFNLRVEMPEVLHRGEPNAEVAKAHAVVLAAKAQADARALADRGDYAKAQMVMRKVADQVKSAAPAYATQLLSTADKLADARSYHSVGRKVMTAAVVATRSGGAGAGAGNEALDALLETAEQRRQRGAFTLMPDSTKKTMPALDALITK